MSNSSSSSFICITADKRVLYTTDEDGTSFETDFVDFNIDNLIKQLKEAKEKGATNVVIEYGGGYDG